MARLSQTQLEKRNRILGFETKKDTFGVRFTLEQLLALQKAKLLDMEQTQNDSPSVETFVNFMVAHPGVKGHGYVIGVDRDDCRVSLEGLEFTGKVTIPLIRDFVKLCHGADELTVDEYSIRSWWD